MSTHKETGERRGHVLSKVTKKSVKSWLVLGLLPPSCPWTVSTLNSTGKAEAKAVVKVVIRGAVSKP